MNAILKSMMKQLAIPLMERLAIPLIHPKAVDKRLVISNKKTVAKWLVIFAATIVASFSFHAAADDITTKDREVMSKEANTPAAEQTSKRRKEMREHVKNRTTPEDRKEMHQKVTERMANKSAKEHDDMASKQTSERRKEMREHVKNRTTPEQRKELHKKVQENMESKSADHDNNKPVTKPAN